MEKKTKRIQGIRKKEKIKQENRKGKDKEMEKRMT